MAAKILQLHSMPDEQEKERGEEDIPELKINKRNFTRALGHYYSNRRNLAQMLTTDQFSAAAIEEQRRHFATAERELYALVFPGSK